MNNIYKDKANQFPVKVCDKVLIKLFIWGINSMYFSFKLYYSRYETTTLSTESILASMSKLRMKLNIHNSAASSVFPVTSAI